MPKGWDAHTRHTNKGIVAIILLLHALGLRSPMSCMGITAYAHSPIPALILEGPIWKIQYNMNCCSFCSKMDMGYRGDRHDKAYRPTSLGSSPPPPFHSFSRMSKVWSSQRRLSAPRSVRARTIGTTSEFILAFRN